ncbi:MAG: electron transfer flavoprotein subunit alpha/FixB family protein, partial [Nitrososphaerales archaeon]
MDERMTASGSDVWVFSERADVALELLGKGRELADGLGGSLCALVLGTALEHEADNFASHGADKVFLVENQALQNNLPEPLAEAVGKLASQYGPEILLIGSTRRGRDIAARVAARLETGVLTDCVALGLDEKRTLVADRPSYGGILVSTEI